MSLLDVLDLPIFRGSGFVKLNNILTCNKLIICGSNKEDRSLYLAHIFNWFELFDVEKVYFSDSISYVF